MSQIKAAKFNIKYKGKPLKCVRQGQTQPDLWFRKGTLTTVGECIADCKR